MPKFLLGNARHQLDDKGRMRIPAKFREGLGGSAYILPGRAGCLFIIPEDKLLETVKSLSGGNPFADTSDNDLSTEIVGNGDYLEEDGQGRVRLSKELAKAAGIVKDVVFVGKLTYLEVWPAETWDERYSVLNPDNLSKMIDKLRKLGV